jgi:hypothetical protein
MPQPISRTGAGEANPVGDRFIDDIRKYAVHDPKASDERHYDYWVNHKFLQSDHGKRREILAHFSDTYLGDLQPTRESSKLLSRFKHLTHLDAMMTRSGR